MRLPADPLLVSQGPTDRPYARPTLRACAQLVTSTDAVVGRTSVKAENLPAVLVTDVGSALRAVRCRFEGGAEHGINVQKGATARLFDCSLAVAALGSACHALLPGSSAVLRDCRIEGCPAAGVAASLRRPSLGASYGGFLALEEGTVDVDGVGTAVMAMDTGEGAGPPPWPLGSFGGWLYII
jgi:hypothetical protein